MMTAIKILAALVCIAVLLILAARLIFALPTVAGRVNSTSLPPPDTGPLNDAIMPQWQDHPGKTGVMPLGNGADAFAARMLLADAAVSSIDAQYYIWHGDLTGSLLLNTLKRAADRGVRVRLLLDDHGTSGLDRQLAALNAHENAEVRLYNPFALRRFKLLSYGFDFFRLNRRMHNKSFTVDGAATILGGRNIGDEYFDTGPTAIYIDLDVLAVGKIVPEVAADFDRYWAAPAVRRAGPILGNVPDGDPIGERVGGFEGNPQMAEYRAILEGSSLIETLRAGSAEIEWTDVILVSDDPAKGMGSVPRGDLLASRLARSVGHVEARFDGISPYFVPGRTGTRAFAALEHGGVQTRMLTNSLEATDVLPVHAGYSKHRRNLLKGGTRLFELKRKAATTTPKDKIGPFGSSGASLHAKTFAVDGARIFIGSFNFDPRSTTLNTEMGLLIDSKAMANQMHDAFDRKLDGMAWEVVLNDGDLRWHGSVSGTVTRREPGSNILKSAAITVIGWLPVEWLL
ncbi:phospholipase D family protein [Roseovarius arcticus]|uniref:phospholipase D family protein n=1 Tax=Roseovarius arcticus TaxID=2547404 RepID=UPI001110BE62|nr:phospholipase D family protein [Roseovarius arcticus]